jgi:predicted porin
MQRKIIALAIASALAAPVVAMADSVGNVALYGQVNVSADRNSSGANPSTNSNSLTNNSSRLGVRGSEDLGDGLAGIFQAEGGVDIATGGYSFNRNTFLGLKSADFGTAVAGNHDSAYKLATRELDLFAYIVAADNEGLNGVALMGSGHDVRRTNSLNYMSPSMGGFGLNVSLAQAQAGFGKSVSVAGTYGMEGMMATLAYDKADKLNATSNEAKAIKLGGSYAMDAFKVNAVVEKATTTPQAGADTKGTNVYLGGQYSLSAMDAIKLAYTKRGNTAVAPAADNNAKQVTLGYDHGMSKRTSIYALYNKITQAGNAADPSVVSVGMKHAF